MTVSYLIFPALLLASQFGFAWSSDCIRRETATICVTENIRHPGLRYDAPIAMVIPHAAAEVGWRPTQIVLYLQGFRGVCRASDGGVDTQASPEQTLKIFDVIGQFSRAISAASISNTLLVFPVSYGQNENYKKQLIGQFGKFTEWVEKETDAVTGVRWHIAGHSGAGAVISAALSRQANGTEKFDSVILLDATYSMGSHLQEWRTIARNQRNVFIESVYLQGSSTAAGSRTLQAELNALKTGNENTLKHPVSILAAREAHCKIPNRHFETLLVKAFDKTTNF